MSCLGHIYLLTPMSTPVYTEIACFLDMHLRRHASAAPPSRSVHSRHSGSSRRHDVCLSAQVRSPLAVLFGLQTPLQLLDSENPGHPKILGGPLKLRHPEAIQVLMGVPRALEPSSPGATKVHLLGRPPDLPDVHASLSWQLGYTR